MITKCICRVITLCLLLLAFVGCGNNPIGLVKNGTLNDYPSVTIGDAFDVSFTDGKWETFETDKKQTVVEFTGIVSRELSKKFEVNLITSNGETPIDLISLKSKITNFKSILAIGEYYTTEKTPVQYKIDKTKLDEIIEAINNLNDVEALTIYTIATSFYTIAETLRYTTKKDPISQILIHSKKVTVQFLFDKDDDGFEVSFFELENSEYKYDDIVEYIFN